MATGVARLGLCGYGRAGLFHFTSIRGNPRVTLSHVIEDESRLEMVRERLSKHNLDHVTVSCPKDFKEKVLSDPQLDALVIASPTHTHEWYVLESLRAGKHVFCEKPVADSLEVIQSCYKQASRSNLLLFCGFNRRFDSGFYNAWRRLREGEIGRVYTIKTTSRDHPNPPIEYLLSSKGISHDSAIHDIDIICWMMGEEPVEVYAQGQAHNPRLEGIDVDVISIMLKFPSGAIGNIEVSRYSEAGYDQRLEIHGEKGDLFVTNPPRKPVTVAAQNGVTSSQYFHSFDSRYKDAYSSEMDHFIDCVLDPNSQLLVTGEEVVRACRVADAVARSLQSKKPEKL